jgi:hypothetical protein
VKLLEKISKNIITVKNNRYILSSMIDSTYFLAQQELVFGGHDKSDLSVNRGNYVELIYLMAQCNELLKTHLATSTILTGLFEDIQNDLIQSISNVLLKQIENEIRDTPFVAIIMDETIYIITKSQLSTVLRYVNTIDGYEVFERFLGFTDVSENQSAKPLSEHVFSFISKYVCEEKLIAQTYDGAAVISRQHNGLQSLVRSKYENAIFVHCYAH